MGSGSGRCVDKLIGVCGNLFDCSYFLSELNAKPLRVRVGLEILEA